MPWPLSVGEPAYYGILIMKLAIMVRSRKLKVNLLVFYI